MDALCQIGVENLSFVSIISIFHCDREKIQEGVSAGSYCLCGSRRVSLDFQKYGNQGNSSGLRTDQMVEDCQSSFCCFT